ncbi:MAG: KTSC domain-containing protein [Burkholderiaceae bacterium]
MVTKTFTTGEITQALYEPSSRYLELHWRNMTIRAFRPVPEEVFRRLCNAPNPATYFEDRIAEEYPSVQPLQRSDTESAMRKLNDLFDN